MPVMMRAMLFAQRKGYEPGRDGVARPPVQTSAALFHCGARPTIDVVPRTSSLRIPRSVTFLSVRNCDFSIRERHGRVPSRASSPRYPKFSSFQPMLQCIISHRGQHRHAADRKFRRLGSTAVREPGSMWFGHGFKPIAPISAYFARRTSSSRTSSTSSRGRWVRLCGKSARHVLWEPGAGDRLR
jgi:hypothetical protein